jgi:hypothetical protein
MELTVNTPAAYTWEDPGGTIRIEIGLDVVERLGAAIQAGLGDGPRGYEAGGILLGSAQVEPRSIVIEDFELWPSQHLRGPSYTLVHEETRKLAAHIARRRSLRVVGFFRSHTRPGLYLDQQDCSVVSQCFPDPSDVVLLVRPSREGPPVAGFFFWEESDMERRWSYRQFPFDHQRLCAGDFPLTYRAEAAASPRPVSVRPPLQIPRVSWLAVPVLAAGFLVAGLITSYKGAHKQAPAPAPATALVAETSPQAVPPPEPVAQAEPVPVPAATPDPIVPPAGQAPVKAPVQMLVAKVAPPAVPANPAPPPVAELLPPPQITDEKPKLVATLPEPRVTPPPSAPITDVSYEAPHSGLFRRAFHRITSIAESDSDAFVPAAPIHKVSPHAPPGALNGDAVDVKVFIDESGRVYRAQALAKHNPLAPLSLDAAREWTFAPARKHGQPVSSELVLHFRFGTQI